MAIKTTKKAETKAEPEAPAPKAKAAPEGRRRQGRCQGRRQG